MGGQLGAVSTSSLSIYNSVKCHQKLLMRLCGLFCESVTIDLLVEVWFMGRGMSEKGIP